MPPEIVEPVTMTEGAGATVRRLFPVPGRRELDPFLVFDEFFVPPGAGFPPHAHEGFEAITYLFAGAFRHEDNFGNKTTVGPGGRSDSRRGAASCTRRCLKGPRSHMVAAGERSRLVIIAGRPHRARTASDT
jgi:hypothetical protein